MKVLVVGSYGTGNIGDEAILNAMIKRLESERHNVSYTCYGKREDKTVNIWSPTVLLNSIIKADNIVFCGGLLSEYMGLFQKICYPTIALFGKILGKRVEFRSISFLKSKGILSAWFRISIKHADYVSVRDVISRTNIAEAKFEKDLAHGLECEKPLRKFGSTVGLVLRPMECTVEFLEILRWLTSTGKILLFIPFCNHKFSRYENDYTFALTLKNQLNGRLKIMDTRKCSPQEVKRLIGEMDSVISSRFHPLIFAYDQSVPFLPIMRDEKIRSFILTYNVNRYITPLTTLEAFKQIWSRQNE